MEFGNWLITDGHWLELTLAVWFIWGFVLKDIAETLTGSKTKLATKDLKIEELERQLADEKRRIYPRNHTTDD
jgi:hypothetical protein